MRRVSHKAIRSLAAWGLNGQAEIWKGQMMFVPPAYCDYTDEMPPNLAVQWWNKFLVKRSLRAPKASIRLVDCIAYAWVLRNAVRYVTNALSNRTRSAIGPG